MAKNTRIALTGFMGVGKSSVARHLSGLLDCGRTDLDYAIEHFEGRRIADIIDTDGEPAYRAIETAALVRVLAEPGLRILSLGGGTWMSPENRDLIRAEGLTSVWLESTFDHCWLNIRASKKTRPLARNKRAAKKLFDQRQSVYCLADWHFIIRPEFTSYDVAKQIAEQIFV